MDVIYNTGKVCVDSSEFRGRLTVVVEMTRAFSSASAAMQCYQIVHFRPCYVREVAQRGVTQG